MFGSSPQTSMYNNSKAMIISSSNSVTHIKDDYMNEALNRVKDSQKKQMKVIQASLKRAERNNIRQAVRSLKEQRMEKNFQDKIQERVENAKMTYEERMANAQERKRKMSAERERMRKISMKKE